MNLLCEGSGNGSVILSRNYWQDVTLPIVSNGNDQIWISILHQE
jgi:hypothetical protein